MQINRSDKSPTDAVLNLTADESFLHNVKTATLKHLAAKHVKVPGFRPGTAPPSVVEKHVDNQQLQSEFLEEAINRMYAAAVKEEHLRPVTDPQVSIKKFVPFNQLEVEINVEIIGSVKLGDYKALHKTQPKIDITAKDINGVIESLRVRMADK